MSKYRKKPVVIEAFQWTGGPDQPEGPEWIVEAIEDGTVWFEDLGTDEVTMEIATLEGNHIASVGDYIIKGVAGEIYPCKPEIFAQSYEPADEPECKMAGGENEIGDSVYCHRDGSYIMKEDCKGNCENYLPTTSDDFKA